MSGKKKGKAPQAPPPAPAAQQQASSTAVVAAPPPISDSGELTLGVLLHAAIDFFRFGRLGRVTFSRDATFTLIREALTDYWVTEISSVPSVANQVLAKSNSNDEGTMQVLVLDDDGWSKEISYGTFASVAADLKQKLLGDEGKRIVLLLRSSRDPIGARQRVAELLYNVRQNKFMVVRVEQLYLEDYVGWRVIRGDGNCYYRAVIMGYLELWLDTHPSKVEVRRTFMRRISDLVASASDYIRDSYGEQGGDFSDLNDKLAQYLSKCLSWEQLESTVLANASFDQALVRVSRALTARYLIDHQEDLCHGISIKDSILSEFDDIYSMSDYCVRMVLRMGVDAEGTLINVGALCHSLGCRGTTVHMDAPKGKSAQMEAEDANSPQHDLLIYPGGDESLPEEIDEESGMGGTVHLMLRSGAGSGHGHYDLLYRRSMRTNEARKAAMLARASYPTASNEQANVVYRALTKPPSQTSPAAPAPVEPEPLSPSNPSAPAPSSADLLYQAQFGPNASKLPDYLASVPDTHALPPVPDKAAPAEADWSDAGGKGKKGGGRAPPPPLAPASKGAKPRAADAARDQEHEQEQEQELGWEEKAVEEEQPLSDKIFGAARSGDVDALSSLLLEANQTVSPLVWIDRRVQAEQYMTPLHAACEKGHVACIELLLAPHKDGKAVNVGALMESRLGFSGSASAAKKAGLTPLMLACLKGQLAVVELLLAHPEASKTASFAGSDEDSALRCALSAATEGSPKQRKAGRKIASLLLQRGLALDEEQKIALSPQERRVHDDLTAPQETKEMRLQRQLCDAVKNSPTGLDELLSKKADLFEALIRWTTASSALAPASGASSAVVVLDHPIVTACKLGSFQILDALLYPRLLGTEVVAADGATHGDVLNPALVFLCVKGAVKDAITSADSSAAASADEKLGFPACLRLLLIPRVGIAFGPKVAKEARDCLTLACNAGCSAVVKALLEAAPFAEVAKEEAQLKLNERGKKTLSALRPKKTYSCKNVGCKKVGTMPCKRCAEKYKIPEDLLEWFCSSECLNAAYATHKKKVHEQQEKKLQDTEERKLKMVLATVGLNKDKDRDEDGEGEGKEKFVLLPPDRVTELHVRVRLHYLIAKLERDLAGADERRITTL